MSDKSLDESLIPKQFDEMARRDKLQVGQLWRRYWGAPGNLDRSWFMVLKVELREENRFEKWSPHDSFLACIEQIIMWGDIQNCENDSIDVWPMSGQGLKLSADVKAKFAALIARHDPEFIRDRINEWTL